MRKANHNRGGRDDEAHEGADPLDVAVLPHDERVGFEVLDVGDGRLRLEAEEEPADVGVEEALGDIVGIFVFIHVLVVDAVVGADQSRAEFSKEAAPNRRTKTFTGHLALKEICENRRW
jgi:hypothetical protein